MSTVAAGVAALLASGEKAAHVAQNGLSLFRSAESNPAAVARFEATNAAATQEMLKDSYAAVKALVAHALDREPSDPEIDAVMMDAAGHPNAPFRFHRLLGEARKSASRRRRRFLASVLFGLPFSKLPDDDRDRVDMTVERMVPADVDLLMRIDEMNRTASPDHSKQPLLFDGTRVAVLVREVSVRIACTDDYGGPPVDRETGFGAHVFSAPRCRPNQVAFGSLSALGCIEVGRSQLNQSPWTLHPLRITFLGALVIRAIEEIRPGFAGSSD